jgi:predicted Rossmann fold nucleotide-binding protein DprA/Smf involved in DNA uptake
MQTMAEMIKAVRLKAFDEGFKAGYQRALNEASQLAGFSEATEPHFSGTQGDEDAGADVAIREGTTQAFALDGVKDSPGSTAVDIRRYAASRGHDKAYQQVYTALMRLEKKDLVKKRGGKWYPGP